MQFLRLSMKKLISIFIALSTVTAQIPSSVLCASFLAPPGGAAGVVFQAPDTAQTGDLSSIVDDGILVVALGGNAFKGETRDQQMASLRGMLEPVATLIKAGQKIVITHGNGLQIGRLLEIEEMLVARGAKRRPMHELIAQTQRDMGKMIQETLQVLGVQDTTTNILTKVLINSDDPMSHLPTKPVGPFMTEDEKIEKERLPGWNIEKRVNPDDPGRQYRRVVPSPIPLNIAELEEIEKALKRGEVPIACGGGGVPVFREKNTGILRGFDGVIDKDRASVILASKLGARRIVILTSTPNAYKHFNIDEQEPLEKITVEQVYEDMNHFETGSMKPKMEAAADFILRGGRTAVITDGRHMIAALKDQAGTRVVSKRMLLGKARMLDIIREQVRVDGESFEGILNHDLPRGSLKALDVGTGKGDFCSAITDMYPGRFGHVVGLDRKAGENSSIFSGKTHIELLREVSIEEFSLDTNYQHYFDIIFLNAPSSNVWPGSLVLLPRLLKPGGIMVVTFHWESFILQTTYATETQGDDVTLSFLLDEIIETDFLFEHTIAAIPNTDGYPQAAYRRVNGMLVMSPDRQNTARIHVSSPGSDALTSL